MQKLPHLVGRAVRETGQAMDRLGLTIAGTEIFKDTVSRHRPVMSLYDKVCMPSRVSRLPSTSPPHSLKNLQPLFPATETERGCGLLCGAHGCRDWLGDAG